MKLYGVLCVTTSSLMLVCSVFAYNDKVTHRDLAETAVQTSVLGSDSTVLSDLGLTSLADQKFLNSQNTRSSIIELVQYGVIQEDAGIRARNHFYNPRTGEGLVSDLCLSFFCNPSPSWALEDDTTYGGQDGSFGDARQFFLAALTQGSQTERERSWGRMFEGLGHIIHHLQDMAQPQHVRNDLHLEADALPNFVENPSLYEHYTAQEIPDNIAGRVRTLYRSGYASVYSKDDPVTFNTPRKFWHTDDGKGIADYTNRGFVSAGTNFFSPSKPYYRDFPQPDFFSGQVTHEDKTALCQEISERSGVPLPTDDAGQALPCVMAFIGTSVIDSYRRDMDGYNAKTSTFSIFDADLQTYSSIRHFTLNKFNFEAAYPFLIKRAVGYSAGLINYFFRGKIDMAPDPQQPGGYLIKNLGTEDLDGTFTLYYDDTDGNRSPVNGGSWPLTIAAGRSEPVPDFNFPFSPSMYLLVFHGTMGEETGAVAAKQIKNTPPMLVFTSDGNAYRSVAEGFGYEWSVLPGWGETAGALLGYGIFTGVMINAEWMLLDGYPLHWVNGQWEWAELSTAETPYIWAMDALSEKELVGEWCSSVDWYCGVVYSADFGQSWQFQSHFSSVGADTPNFLRAIGDGEVAMGIRSSDSGPWRVFRSRNHGGAWTEMAMPEGTDYWLVYEMAWNRRDGAERVLLAYGWAADSILAVWKSTDGGNHWRVVWESDIYTCYENVTSLALSPDGRGLMTTTNCTGGAQRLYWSVDAGETWTAAEPPAEAPTDRYGVMSVDYYQPTPEQ